MYPNPTTEAGGRDVLALLACSKSKQPGEIPAREKYAAPRAQLFKKSRAYVEALGLEYLILSGKYGALAPDDVIGDYNVSVRDRDVAAWRADVLAALEERDVDLDEWDDVLVLAGCDYYEPLADDLEAADTEIQRPLADCAGYGYMIGRLSSWLEDLEPDPIVTDGGTDLPELIAGVEEGDELTVTTGEGTVLEGRVKRVACDGSLAEADLTGVSGESERPVLENDATLFSWGDATSGDWQPLQVHFDVGATEEVLEKDPDAKGPVRQIEDVADVADDSEVLATDERGQTQLVTDGDEPADELDRDDPQKCHALSAGGRQCRNSFRSNAADKEAKLCGTHAGASNVSRIDAVDGEPHAEFRDELAEAGLATSHAYALATITDDPEELWRLATGLEDVDVGGETYEASTLASLADDIATLEGVDAGDHPLAKANCVAVIDGGSDDDYQCRSGSYSTKLLCGMHTDVNDLTTIYDVEETDLELQRTEIDGTEYLAIEQRGADLIAIELPAYEVVRLEDAADVQDVAEPVATGAEDKTSLSGDGARDDQEGDVELAEAGELDRERAREAVLDEIAQLLERGLSPAQALDYYATSTDDELPTYGGYTQTDWSDRRGRSKQAISDTVGTAREVLEDGSDGD